ncbi:MAG: AGE family epimerase/isomerase [Reichenbachiella sp.]
MKEEIKVAFDQKSWSDELGRVLSFWIENMPDNQYGGYLGRIDFDNNIDVKGTKGLVLNSRILWTFSAAAIATSKGAYQECADRAYRYLMGNFVDSTYGGMYWMLDHEGKPKDTKKQIYAQAFAIYGLSEYYKLTQDQEALDMAMNLFDTVELYSFDANRNGYFEAFDQQWQVMEDLRLSDKDKNEAKTMNTHLHILEAYSNLYKVSKDYKVKSQLNNIVELFLKNFLNEKTAQYLLFFDEDWNSKSDEVSYGHDIEIAWLIQEAAETLQEKELIERTKLWAVNTATATLPFFDADGALYNAGNQIEIVDRDKHWWPQAEALVGLVNAYQVSGDDSFIDQAKACWQFINQKIMDQENGEWIWGVHADGEPMKEDKAGPWKCPYHNGRALMELIQRLGN